MLYLALLTTLAWVTLALTAAAPGMVGGDGPELTAAAFHLGSAHAPGYPLFITLGRLFQLMPLGTPSFRMTFLSILTQAGAFLALTWTLKNLLRKPEPPLSLSSPPRGESFGGFSPSPFRGEGRGEGAFLVLFTASLVFAGPLVFHQVVSPEVFALHLLFVALFLRFVLLPTPVNFLPAAFLAGVALSHQHLTLLILPALGWAYRSHFRDPLKAALACALFLIGLTPYLILPIRAVQNPLVNWGNPSNFSQFLYHVTRTQYGGDITQGSFMNGLMDFYLYLKDLSLESYGVGLALILLGVWKGRVRFKAEYYIGGFLLFILLPFLIRGSYDPENNHVNEAFLPPAILWFSPLMLKGLGWVFEKVGQWRKSLVVVLLTFLTFQTFRSYIQTNVVDNFAVEDVTRSMLLQMPLRSVMFSEGDAVTFPLAYLNLVLKLRPDAALFDRTGGLFTDLYHLLDYRKRPEISPPEEVGIEKKWELQNHPSVGFYTENTDVPGRAITMTGLLFQVVDEEARRIPETLFWNLAREPRIQLNHDYLSRETASRYYLFKAPFDLDVRKDPVQGWVDLKRGKELGYDNSRLLVNAGLVENSHDQTDQAALTFEKACLLNPDFYLPWYDRGVVAEKQNHLRQAISYFQKAIQLAPNDTDAHQELGFVFYKAKKFEEAVQEWETVRKLDPLYAEAYRNLGFMYMQRQPNYAAQLIRQYLILNPRTPDKSSLEKWLSSQPH